MTERLINIQIHWSEPDEGGARTLLGVTPATRNDDGSDPPAIFVERALLNPQIANALERNAFPALIAARAAKLDALEPPEQKKARLAEAAEARRTKAEADTAKLDEELEARRAELKKLDIELEVKRASVAESMPTEA